MVRTCIRCDEVATGACPRCGEPACAAHAPDESARCERCEDQFAARWRRRFVPYGVVAAFAAIATVFVLLRVMPRLDSVFENETRRVYIVLFVSLFGSIFAALGVIQLFRWSARKRFLDETRDPVPDARVVKLPE